MIDAIHKTSDMFMEEIGWTYWELHEQHGLGLPLVSMGFDFMGQVHGGDDIKIELNATVGESSVQFKYRASHNGEVVFEGTEHRVCVPMDGDSGITIPDDLREALESV